MAFNANISWGYGYGVQRYFLQYFSYIAMVSFIDEGNWRNCK